MALSSYEIEIMQGMSLSETGSTKELYEQIRGGECWFFPASHSISSTDGGHSAVLPEMEKRLTQSKRQSKDESLRWVEVNFSSGTFEGNGLLIQGLSRLQATKFAYKLKLTSIMLYTPHDSLVVVTGFSL